MFKWYKKGLSMCGPLYFGIRKIFLYAMLAILAFVDYSLFLSTSPFETAQLVNEAEGRSETAGLIEDFFAYNKIENCNYNVGTNFTYYSIIGKLNYKTDGEITYAPFELSLSVANDDTTFYNENNLLIRTPDGESGIFPKYQKAVKQAFETELYNRNFEFISLTPFDNNPSIVSNGSTKIPNFFKIVIKETNVIDVTNFVFSESTNYSYSYIFSKIGQKSDEIIGNPTMPCLTTNSDTTTQNGYVYTDDENIFSSVQLYVYKDANWVSVNPSVYVLNWPKDANSVEYNVNDDGNGNNYTYTPTGKTKNQYSLYYLMNPTWNVEDYDYYTTSLPGVYYSNNKNDLTNAELVNNSNITSFEAQYKTVVSNESYFQAFDISDYQITYEKNGVYYLYNKTNTYDNVYEEIKIDNINFYIQQYEADSFTAYDLNNNKYGDPNFVEQSYYKKSDDENSANFYFYNENEKIFYIYKDRSLSKYNTLDSTDFKKENTFFFNSELKANYYNDFFQMASQYNIEKVNTATTPYNHLQDSKTVAELNNLKNSTTNSGSNITYTKYEYDKEADGYRISYAYTWKISGERYYNYETSYVKGEYVLTSCDKAKQVTDVYTKNEATVHAYNSDYDTVTDPANGYTEVSDVSHLAYTDMNSSYIYKNGQYVLSVGDAATYEKNNKFSVVDISELSTTPSFTLNDGTEVYQYSKNGNTLYYAKSQNDTSSYLTPLVLPTADLSSLPTMKYTTYDVKYNKDNKLITANSPLGNNAGSIAITGDNKYTVGQNYSTNLYYTPYYNTVNFGSSTTVRESELNGVTIVSSEEELKQWLMNNASSSGTKKAFYQTGSIAQNTVTISTNSPLQGQPFDGSNKSDVELDYASIRGNDGSYYHEYFRLIDYSKFNQIFRMKSSNNIVNTLTFKIANNKATITLPYELERVWYDFYYSYYKYGDNFEALVHGYNTYYVPSTGSGDSNYTNKTFFSNSSFVGKNFFIAVTDTPYCTDENKYVGADIHYQDGHNSIENYDATREFTLEGDFTGRYLNFVIFVDYEDGYEDGDIIDTSDELYAIVYSVDLQSTGSSGVTIQQGGLTGNYVTLTNTGKGSQTKYNPYNSFTSYVEKNGSYYSLPSNIKSSFDFTAYTHTKTDYSYYTESYTAKKATGDLHYFQAKNSADQTVTYSFNKSLEKYTVISGTPSVAYGTRKDEYKISGTGVVNYLSIEDYNYYDFTNIGITDNDKIKELFNLDFFVSVNGKKIGFIKKTKELPSYYLISKEHYTPSLKNKNLGTYNGNYYLLSDATNLNVYENVTLTLAHTSSGFLSDDENNVIVFSSYEEVLDTVNSFPSNTSYRIQPSYNVVTFTKTSSTQENVIKEYTNYYSSLTSAQYNALSSGTETFVNQNGNSTPYTLVSSPSVTTNGDKTTVIFDYVGTTTQMTTRITSETYTMKYKSKEYFALTGGSTNANIALIQEKASIDTSTTNLEVPNLEMNGSVFYIPKSTKYTGYIDEEANTTLSSQSDTVLISVEDYNNISFEKQYEIFGKTTTTSLDYNNYLPTYHGTQLDYCSNLGEGYTGACVLGFVKKEVATSDPIYNYTKSVTTYNISKANEQKVNVNENYLDYTSTNNFKKYYTQNVSNVTNKTLENGEYVLLSPTYSNSTGSLAYSNNLISPLMLIKSGFAVSYNEDGSVSIENTNSTEQTLTIQLNIPENYYKENSNLYFSFEITDLNDLNKIVSSLSKTSSNRYYIEYKNADTISLKIKGKSTITLKDISASHSTEYTPFVYLEDAISNNVNYYEEYMMFSVPQTINYNLIYEKDTVISSNNFDKRIDGYIKQTQISPTYSYENVSNTSQTLTITFTSKKDVTYYISYYLDKTFISNTIVANSTKTTIPIPTFSGQFVTGICISEENKKFDDYAYGDTVKVNQTGSFSVEVEKAQPQADYEQKTVKSTTLYLEKARNVDIVVSYTSLEYIPYDSTLATNETQSHINTFNNSTTNLVNTENNFKNYVRVYKNDIAYYYPKNTLTGQYYLFKEMNELLTKNHLPAKDGYLVNGNLVNGRYTRLLYAENPSPYHPHKIAVRATELYSYGSFNPLVEAGNEISTVIDDNISIDFNGCNINYSVDKLYYTKSIVAPDDEYYIPLIKNGKYLLDSQKNVSGNKNIEAVLISSDAKLFENESVKKLNDDNQKFSFVILNVILTLSDEKDNDGNSIFEISYSSLDGKNITESLQPIRYTQNENGTYTIVDSNYFIDPNNVINYKTANGSSSLDINFYDLLNAPVDANGKRTITKKVPFILLENLNDDAVVSTELAVSKRVGNYVAFTDYYNPTTTSPGNKGFVTVNEYDISDSITLVDDKTNVYSHLIKQNLPLILINNNPSNSFDSSLMSYYTYNELYINFMKGKENGGVKTDPKGNYYIDDPALDYYYMFTERKTSNALASMSLTELWEKLTTYDKINGEVSAFTNDRILVKLSNDAEVYFKFETLMKINTQLTLKLYSLQEKVSISAPTLVYQQSDFPYSDSINEKNDITVNAKTNQTLTSNYISSSNTYYVKSQNNNYKFNHSKLFSTKNTNGGIYYISQLIFRRNSSKVEFSSAYSVGDSLTGVDFLLRSRYGNASGVSNSAYELYLSSGIVINEKMYNLDDLISYYQYAKNMELNENTFGENGYFNQIIKAMQDYFEDEDNILYETAQGSMSLKDAKETSTITGGMTGVTYTELALLNTDKRSSIYKNPTILYKNSNFVTGKFGTSMFDLILPYVIYNFSPYTSLKKYNISNSYEIGSTIDDRQEFGLSNYTRPTLFEAMIFASKGDNVTVSVTPVLGGVGRTGDHYNMTQSCNSDYPYKTGGYFLKASLNTSNTDFINYQGSIRALEQYADNSEVSFETTMNNNLKELPSDGRNIENYLSQFKYYYSQVPSDFDEEWTGFIDGINVSRTGYLRNRQTSWSNLNAITTFTPTSQIGRWVSVCDNNGQQQSFLIDDKGTTTFKIYDINGIFSTLIPETPVVPDSTQIDGSILSNLAFWFSSSGSSQMNTRDLKDYYTTYGLSNSAFNNLVYIYARTGGSIATDYSILNNVAGSYYQYRGVGSAGNVILIDSLWGYQPHIYGMAYDNNYKEDTAYINNNRSYISYSGSNYSNNDSFQLSVEYLTNYQISYNYENPAYDSETGEYSTISLPTYTQLYDKNPITYLKNVKLINKDQTVSKYNAYDFLKTYTQNSLYSQFNEKFYNQLFNYQGELPAKYRGLANKIVANLLYTNLLSYKYLSVDLSDAITNLESKGKKLYESYHQGLSEKELSIINNFLENSGMVEKVENSNITLNNPYTVKITVSDASLTTGKQEQVRKSFWRSVAAIFTLGNPFETEYGQTKKEAQSFTVNSTAVFAYTRYYSTFSFDVVETKTSTNTNLSGELINFSQILSDAGYSFALNNNVSWPYIAYNPLQLGTSTEVKNIDLFKKSNGASFTISGNYNASDTNYSLFYDTVSVGGELRFAPTSEKTTLLYNELNGGLNDNEKVLKAYVNILNNFKNNKKYNEEYRNKLAAALDEAIATYNSINQKYPGTSQNVSYLLQYTKGMQEIAQYTDMLQDLFKELKSQNIVKGFSSSGYYQGLFSNPYKNVIQNTVGNNSYSSITDFYGSSKLTVQYTVPGLPLSHSNDFLVGENQILFTNWNKIGDGKEAQRLFTSFATGNNLLPLFIYRSTADDYLMYDEDDYSKNILWAVPAAVFTQENGFQGYTNPNSIYIPCDMLNMPVLKNHTGYIEYKLVTSETLKNWFKIYTDNTNSVSIQEFMSINKFLEHDDIQQYEVTQTAKWYFFFPRIESKTDERKVDLVNTDKTFNDVNLDDNVYRALYNMSLKQYKQNSTIYEIEPVFIYNARLSFLWLDEGFGCSIYFNYGLSPLYQIFLDYTKNLAGDTISYSNLTPKQAYEKYIIQSQYFNVDTDYTLPYETGMYIKPVCADNSTKYKLYLNKGNYTANHSEDIITYLNTVLSKYNYALPTNDKYVIYQSSSPVTRTSLSTNPAQELGFNTSSKSRYINYNYYDTTREYNINYLELIKYYNLSNGVKRIIIENQDALSGADDNKVIYTQVDRELMWFIWGPFGKDGEICSLGDALSNKFTKDNVLFSNVVSTDNTKIEYDSSKILVDANKESIVFDNVTQRTLKDNDTLTLNTNYDFYINANLSDLNIKTTKPSIENQISEFDLAELQLNAIQDFNYKYCSFYQYESLNIQNGVVTDFTDTDGSKKPSLIENMYYNTANKTFYSADKKFIAENPYYDGKKVEYSESAIGAATVIVKGQYQKMTEITRPPKKTYYRIPYTYVGECFGFETTRTIYNNVVINNTTGEKIDKYLTESYAIAWLKSKTHWYSFLAPEYKEFIGVGEPEITSQEAIGERKIQMSDETITEYYSLLPNTKEPTISHIMYSISYTPSSNASDVCAAGYTLRNGKCYYTTTNGTSNKFIYNNEYYLSISPNEKFNNSKTNDSALDNMIHIENLVENTLYSIKFGFETDMGVTYYDSQIFYARTGDNMVANPLNPNGKYTIYDLPASGSMYDIMTQQSITYTDFKYIFADETIINQLLNNQYYLNALKTNSSNSFVLQGTTMTCGPNENEACWLYSSSLSKMSINDIGYRFNIQYKDKDAVDTASNWKNLNVSIENDFKLVENASKTTELSLGKTISFNNYLNNELYNDNIYHSLKDSDLYSIFTNKCASNFDLLQTYILSNYMIKFTNNGAINEMKDKDIKVTMEFWYYDSFLYMDYNGNGKYDTTKLGTTDGYTFSVLDQNLNPALYEVVTYGVKNSDGSVKGIAIADAKELSISPATKQRYDDALNHATIENGGVHQTALRFGIEQYTDNNFYLFIASGSNNGYIGG